MTHTAECLPSKWSLESLHLYSQSVIVMLDSVETFSVLFFFLIGVRTQLLSPVTEGNGEALEKIGARRC